MSMFVIGFYIDNLGRYPDLFVGKGNVPMPDHFRSANSFKKFKQAQLFGFVTKIS
jgi:hypothetical protein